jgi:predicted secreted acid phosphatase
MPGAELFLTEGTMRARIPRMQPVFLARVIFVVITCAFAGCAAVARREPVNLTARKAELVRYHDSGAYERGLTEVAKQASRWIEKRAAKRTSGERLAVIFDIDETVLSNWANMQRDDFSYISDRWHAWLDRAEAAVIGPVRDTVFAAQHAGVAVIFLTGRKERDRPATERNLRTAGLGDYAMLIVETEAEAAKSGGSTAVFKTEVRKRLEAEGWTIIANVGDQQSDLAGGYAEKIFKLPNPFYFTE